ncbi:hypothetical protein Syun_012434 [Stephania yunnanensis]|uniref:Uncharacterized protein n=1 Tax=Stephania yunnanensis TaxID=152371 RepID=A0AAP0PHI0_9MAGN
MHLLFRFSFNSPYISTNTRCSLFTLFHLLHLVSVHLSSFSRNPSFSLGSSKWRVDVLLVFWELIKSHAYMSSG